MGRNSVDVMYMYRNRNNFNVRGVQYFIQFITVTYNELINKVLAYLYCIYKLISGLVLTLKVCVCPSVGFLAKHYTNVELDVGDPGMITCVCLSDFKCADLERDLTINQVNIPQAQRQSAKMIAVCDRTLFC